MVSTPSPLQSGAATGLILGPAVAHPHDDVEYPQGCHRGVHSVVVPQVAQPSVQRTTVLGEAAVQPAPPTLEVAEGALDDRVVHRHQTRPLSGEQLAGDGRPHAEDGSRVGSTFAACFGPDAIVNRLGNILGHFVLMIANFIGSVIAYVWTQTVGHLDDIRGTSHYVITVQRAASQPASTEPVLSATGFGPLNFGATVEQAGDALGAPLTSEGGSCWDSDAFPEVAFVVRDGIVVAAGVNRAPGASASSVRTDTGVTLESARGRAGRVPGNDHTDQLRGRLHRPDAVGRRRRGHGAGSVRHSARGRDVLVVRR